MGRLKQPESPAEPQADLELPFSEPLVKGRLPGRLPGQVASAGFVGQAARVVLQAVQFSHCLTETAEMRALQTPSRELNSPAQGTGRGGLNTRP